MIFDQGVLAFGIAVIAQPLSNGVKGCLRLGRPKRPRHQLPYSGDPRRLLRLECGRRSRGKMATAAPSWATFSTTQLRQAVDPMEENPLSSRRTSHLVCPTRCSAADAYNSSAATRGSGALWGSAIVRTLRHESETISFVALSTITGLSK